MPYALLLFIAMPIVEIALLLRVGSALGWITTLLIVIATAFLGTAMLRQQGLATLAKARARLDSGQMPAEQMLEGMLIMIGGVLLLTPGFVTDAFGFACLIPFSRRWLASKVASRAIVGMSASSAPFTDRTGSAAAGPEPEQVNRAGSRKSNQSSNGDIIDGDYRRLDED